MIQYGNNGLGYVAQHHLRCTPYLCQQLELYNIRPIVTYRNVYDSLVSLDDMMRKQQQEWAATRDKDAIYFSDGLPSNYCELDDETRYLILVDRQCAWYLQFFMSWKRCEALGLVKPLWVSYEEDFLGNKQRLAERIAAFVGLEFIDSVKLSRCFPRRSRRVMPGSTRASAVGAGNCLSVSRIGSGRVSISIAMILISLKYCRIDALFLLVLQLRQAR